MKRYYLLVLALVVLLAAIGLAQRAYAQSPCPHVDFHLETTQPLDQEAICEAAGPWAEAGIHIFIFLTDERPSSEAEWFERLDQVEAEAGLRDLSQPDNFDRNSLAFESSTSEASWANTITYGEALFGTRLDTNDAALNRVKSQIRNGLQNGNPTGAFIEALQETYAINYPPPSPFLTGAVVIIVLGIVGGAVALLYRPVIQPVLQRARRRRQLEGQLAILQKNVANLLLAGERLLNGSTPEETVLYQLFEAYGGRLYPERDTAVREWLRRSQTALRAAFDLRLSLESEEAQKGQSLEQQVRNWEMIYLTLAGSSPRILELSNEALQDLLDPLVILEREESEAQLVAQLNDIRRQIEGLPLKVALLVVDPSQTDQEGILGYIDQVEEQIAELMAAQQQAPEHLEEAKRERLEAEEEIASARPFGMTGSQVFRGIDERLTQAESDLKKGVHLAVIETAESVGRDLQIVADLVAAVAEHEERQSKITAITEQGYRPTHLEIISQEIERDKQHIVQAIGENDYMAADNWIDELDADSVRALAEAEAWRARHQANEEALARLRQEIARAEAQIATATDAWATLRHYPEGNWANVTNGPEQAVQLLQRLRDNALSEIAQHNDMATQQVLEAEAMLDQAGADLAQAERQLQAIANRLAEVQTAEANIAEGIRLVQEDLARAVNLRDAEDTKIGPEVDEQLAAAGQHLAEARRLAAAREFITAMQVETTARQLATEAYAAASEQVERINQLQVELARASQNASRQIESTLAEGELLSPLARTTESNKLFQELDSHMSQAWQAQAAAMPLEDHALAQALAATVQAFFAAGQLADRAQERLTADRQLYESLRSDALEEIRRAEGAIKAAERAISRHDAGRAGEMALSRARNILPAEETTANATQETLSKVKEDAKLAYDYAREAERKAEQAIRDAQRPTIWTIPGSTPGWSGSGWPYTPGSGSWSRTSNRSSSRSPGRSSSRSPSGGASRRSTSSGSARRSSSMGSARRSSSTGRSHRR